MGFFFDLLGGLANQLANNSENDDMDCDWYCDECGEYMNDQPGFTVRTGTWKCAACGAYNDVSESNIRYNDDDDEDDSLNDDDIPEGCAACGGPYPDCTTSCPIFDD